MDWKTGANVFNFCHPNRKSVLEKLLMYGLSSILLFTWNLPLDLKALLYAKQQVAYEQIYHFVQQNFLDNPKRPSENHMNYP